MLTYEDVGVREVIVDYGYELGEYDCPAWYEEDYENID